MSFGTFGFGRWLRNCYGGSPDANRYTQAAYFNSYPCAHFHACTHFHSHSRAHFHPRAHRYTETTYTYTNSYPSPHPHPCAYVHTKAAHAHANSYFKPHSHPCAHFHAYSQTQCHTDTTSANTDPYPGPSYAYSCAYCHLYAGCRAPKCGGSNDRYPCWRVHHGQRP